MAFQRKQSFLNKQFHVHTCQNNHIHTARDKQNLFRWRLIGLKIELSTGLHNFFLQLLSIHWQEYIDKQMKGCCWLIAMWNGDDLIFALENVENF